MRLVPLLVLGLATGGCDSGKPTKTSSSSSQTTAQPAWVADLPRAVRTPALVADSTGTLLIATPQAIVIDGTSVVAITQGAVAAEEKEEGGAKGLKIPRIAQFLTTLKAKHGGPAEPLLVAMERNLPYQLLVEILVTATQKDVGVKKFHILVTDGRAPLAIPLALPEKVAMASVAMAGRTPTVRGPDSRITVDDASATSESSLTSDAVVAKIQSVYMAGLKRCYKDALKRDAALEGALTLSLTVDETGRSVKTGAKGVDTEVDGCIGRMMTSWRFPIPKDKDGEAVSSTFTIRLQLAPEDGGANKQEGETAHDPASSLAEKVKGEESKATVQSLPGEVHERPASDPPMPIMQDPDKMPIGLIVAMPKDKLLVWSISGMEGTIQAPLLAADLADPTAMKRLNAVLVDIVKRRWEGKDRPPATQTIVLMPDPATTMQAVADVLVAVRTSVDGGTPLFPDVQLSTGFE